MYAKWIDNRSTVTKSVNGSTTSVRVANGSIYDPGEVSDISTTVKFNGWESNTSNIDIYTDAIYTYYGGENCGALPTQTTLTNYDGAISLPMSTFGFTNYVSSYTLIMTASLSLGHTGYYPIQITDSTGRPIFGIRDNGSSSIAVISGGATQGTFTTSWSGYKTLAIVYDSTDSYFRIYVDGYNVNTIRYGPDLNSSYTMQISTYGGWYNFRNVFFIPEVVDVTSLDDSYAAKEETGNFLMVVNGSGTITANYAVDIPTGSNYTYDGSSKTGVASGTGYSRSGTYTATNAGNYTATVSLGRTYYCWEDGTTANKSISWSIARYNLGLGSYSVTYTGASTYSRTFSGFLTNNVSVTATYRPYSPDVGSYTYSTSSASGRYTVTLSSNNFVISSSGAGTFTINPAEIEYTSSGYSGVYTGTVRRITVSVTSPTSGYSITYSTNGTTYTSTNPGYSSAGTRTIYFRITADNYETVNGSETITITRRSISIPSANEDLVYNGSSQTGVSAGTGYTRGGTYTATNAGTYTATVTPTSNYMWIDGTTSSRTITWSIAKYGLSISTYSVTWTGATTYSRSVSGVSDETVTLTYRPYSSNVGTYTYSTSSSSGRFTLTLSNSANYSVSSVGNFTINSASISYTASGYSGVYDGSAHSITVSVTTPSSGYSITYSTSENGSYTSTKPTYINAGTYTVYFRITASNYTTVSGNRTVTITRASISVPSAVSGLTYNGQTQTGVLAGTGYTVTGNTGVNAGSYTATVTPTSNYQWTDGTTNARNVQWFIAQYGLTISAYTVTWTGADTYSRTVAGVNSESVTLTYTPYSTTAGTYTYSTTATSDSYTLSLSSNNYTVASAGDLTLETASLEYTVSNYTGAYDGQSHSITVSVTVPSSGYSIRYATSEEGPFSRNEITYTDAGTYTIYFKIAADNYTTVSGSGTVTITRAGIDVPTAVSGLVYNGQTQTGVLAGTGYTVTGNTATNAGIYTATVTLNANYVWSDGTTGSKSVQWSIDKKDLTITAEDKSMVYGASAPTYTYSASGLVNGETSSVLGGTAVYSVTSGSTPITDVTTANVGTYTITVSGLTSNNYEISYLPGELEITTRNIADCNIVLSQTSYTFDGTEKEPGVTVMIGNFTVPTSNYTVEYNNNINVGTRAEVIVTSNGNNLTGSTTVYFEIVTRAYTITYDTNGGDSINASSYNVSATSQEVTLTEPSRTGYTFMSYTITTNTTGGTATITGGTTLNIPANAYGDITVTATWSVPVTIEIVGQESENTLTISDGTHTLTTGNNAVAEGSNITINTTLTANADASEYQLFSIYKDNELLITTSSLLDTEYTTTLNEAITTACTIRLEYKEGKRIVVNTDQGVTSEIEITGTSDGDVYATDADNTITITIDTSSIAGSATDNYIGFTYVIDGETHSSYNTGDGIVRPAGNTDNEYTYTITGTDGITSIDVIIRQAQSVVLNTNVAGYNSLSLTSEDGFTRQLDRSTSTYSLYVGIWEINVDLAEGANITDVLNAVFGSANYTEDNGRYYYTITA